MTGSQHQLSTEPGYVLVRRPDNYEVDWSELPAFFAELSTYCEEAGCRNVILVGSNTNVKLSTMGI